MADLITPAELATWTQSDPVEVEADPWALEVLEKVSAVVRFLAGQPAWERETTPIDARLVALKVAKRAYQNPDQEVSSTVGPTSSRVLDVAALLFDFTEGERSTLTRYNPNGDPDNSGGLHVITTTTRREQELSAVLFVPDDSLSDWYIPLFTPGDPGDPNLYREP